MGTVSSIASRSSTRAYDHFHDNGIAVGAGSTRAVSTTTCRAAGLDAAATLGAGSTTTGADGFVRATLPRPPGLARTFGSWATTVSACAVSIGRVNSARTGASGCRALPDASQTPTTAAIHSPAPAPKPANQ